jgi:hypothetical protein
MPTTVLFKPEVVIELYMRTMARDGNGSARETAILLSQHGYVNPRTGKPLTKQAVLECLRKSEKGRQLLAITSKNKWKGGRYSEKADL